ncbi:MAG: ribosomal protein S18-alanine N-acetyltransferase [Oscillospiraceae bacterium]|nr:ribosomal protein S18-alanine N-acetyltransferase [Oscillospiraceae bacterium]
MQIRKAERADLPGLVAIEDLSFSEPWSHASMASAVENPDIYTAVSLEGGTVTGYVILALMGIEAEIYNVAVHPDARRQGLGAALLQNALKKAEQEGAETVFLEVRASNAPAKALYLGHGFVPVGLRKKYYTNPTEDAILMACTVERDGEERT